MAYQFARITWRGFYYGHRIEKVENPIQEVFVVDGDMSTAYWSMADARRSIKGDELKYCPVDVRHWFK